ncbi:AVAST type 1 anti-phage system protease Avs1b [Pseudomonas iridis]|uniref:AVAST type 1 anti-phage system protease Avs1b n=1 Tax=Pseudomonas iridis TaxID=2710587 RepID=UPI0037C942A0
MTGEEVKQATCQVIGKGESGTGWLISPELVLTAYHCVTTEVAAGEHTTIRFRVGSTEIEQRVTPQSFDEDLDVCLLRLQEPLPIAPITIDVKIPREGERWNAFGYPVLKLALGHALNGEIQQVLSERLHGVDLDLSVEPGTHLSEYHGLSGSALMVGTVCRGMLRLNIDNSIGAVSLAKLQPFLADNGLMPNESDPVKDDAPIGLRPDFDEHFESSLIKKGGGYLFVDGPHGIGKSTYCRSFTPQASQLETLGVYALTERGHGLTPAHQAQPEVFFDWANSLLSSKTTGKPARLLELSYVQLIERTHEVLQALANRCTKAGKVGVLFIDGINEAAAVGRESLQRFVSLLPPKVPQGLVIVITGVGLDALASGIGSILEGAERLTLPVLEREIQYGLCVEFLERDKASPELVATLCDRAMGHPLYLRYLVDLVNGGASEGDIAELPAFSGSIQDYYETIWSHLISDADAINLLGIIARLRWGIPTSDLTSMLTPAESGVFVPTLTRIRHLLSRPENTEIYHPSFSEFIAHKTTALSQRIHTRLAQFCGLPVSGDYGELNKICHGLLGDREAQLHAIKVCQQDWVDRSVLLGAEPDVLLSDIDETLASATLIGTATDTVRLLLLSQRLTFRYDTLFAQSAELVALALLSLGKTDEAIRHVVRNGRLIVDVDEVFAVANAFTRSGRYEEALTLLEKSQHAVNSVFERWQSEGSVSTEVFFNAVSARLRGYGLALAAGGDPPVNAFLSAIVKVITLNPKNSLSDDERSEVLQLLTGDLVGSQLCLQGKYRSFSQLDVPGKVDPCHQLMIFLQALAHAEMHSRHYSIQLPKDMVDLLLSDIERVIDAPLRFEDRRFVFSRALIDAGANPKLVEAYSTSVDFGDESLSFSKENRAEIDESAFCEAFDQLRAKFFLRESVDQPLVQMPMPGNWETTLKSVAVAIAWSDARARRAKALSDQAALDETWSFVTSYILPSLSFTLASRIRWKGSYSIPEVIVPLLYERLARLMLDCFPQGATALLEYIEQAFNDQLGVYNEGFRRAIQIVVSVFIVSESDQSTSDSLFNLVLRWRDYVEVNVENRFELVPELLHIVPLLSRLGATEEAHRTYQSALSFSMGPSWYKEDQLSMMSGTLESLSIDSAVPASSLAQIAAYLERASGEMTFQRYVRADKGNFIGQLCRRSLYADAVEYFKHQACGSLEQLFAQTSAGNLDRISSLVGMRFPGGALEEQAALLALLRQARGQTDWRLRWALLEVYQHGDERHLTDWGREYAEIITELAGDSGDLAWAAMRIRSIAHAMNSERAQLLLGALVSRLPAGIQSGFTDSLNETKAALSTEQHERLAASLDLRHEQDHKAASPPNESKTNVDDELDDERLFMPGTFGKQSATKDAATALQTAQSQLNRRNSSAAVQECIRALRAFQSGGWSIWSGDGTTRDADRLIQSQIEDGDALVHLYGPLILEERHVQRWRIASHLIELVGEKVDPVQQASLLAVAVDHVGQMVGSASQVPFSYIGKGETVGASAALFELLLWTLDHPAWERRDSGAAMMLWLLRSSDAWVPHILQLAVSMDRQNRADIAAATLDIMSQENPIGLWERIAPHIDIAQIIERCQHVGRFATFLRIAERASKQSNTSAVDVVKAIKETLGEKFSPARPDAAPPSYVPQSMRGLWQTLARLGVFTEASLLKIESEMADYCSPLAIDVAEQVEMLVADGFREAREFSTGRWAAKMRCALHVALFYPMPVEQLFRIEAALRVYNPGTLTEPRNGKSLLADLVSLLKAGAEQDFKPSNENLVYLDLQCILEIGRDVAHVDITSFLVPPGPLGSLRPPRYTFKSTELPHPGPREGMTICGKVDPVVAYFGSFSPAIPTQQFLQFISATPSATVRYHWRDGSTVTSIGSSRRYEAALLAIQRGALALPTGWRICWALRVNNELQAILNKF